MMSGICMPDSSCPTILARMTTPCFASTCHPGTLSNSKSRIIKARIALASAMLKREPMHPRGPAGKESTSQYLKHGDVEPTAGGDHLPEMKLMMCSGRPESFADLGTSNHRSGSYFSAVGPQLEKRARERARQQGTTGNLASACAHMSSEVLTT